MLMPYKLKMQSWPRPRVVTEKKWIDRWMAKLMNKLETRFRINFFGVMQRIMPFCECLRSSISHSFISRINKYIKTKSWHTKKIH